MTAEVRRGRVALRGLGLPCMWAAGFSLGIQVFTSVVQQRDSGDRAPLLTICTARAEPELPAEKGKVIKKE